MLKIDVESAEWPFLRDLLFSDDGSTLRRIRQIIMEVHTPASSSFFTALKRKPPKKEDFIEIIYYFIALKSRGFKLYRGAHEMFCCGGFPPFLPDGVPERCCYEVNLFNTKLETAQ